MKPYARIAAAAAAALLVLAACEDNPFIIGRFGVAGRWAGSTLAGEGGDTVRFHFDLRLRQDRSDVSGDGEIRGGSAAIPVGVRGRWEAAGTQVNLTLRMSSPDVAPLEFAGTFDLDTVPRPAPDSGSVVVVDTDTLVGVLTGSALDNVPLRLGRVPP